MADKKARRSVLLEQGTGVEPAFTAWEAVVLPIYEPCILGIIAYRNGNFKPFSPIFFDKFRSAMGQAIPLAIIY